MHIQKIQNYVLTNFTNLVRLFTINNPIGSVIADGENIFRHF